MSTTFEYLMRLLGLLFVASPTLGFVAWRFWKNGKMLAQGLPLGRRVLQGLLSVVLALVGCIAIGFASRALETSSTVGWLISLSMFAAYSWYLLVAALICSIPILSLWVICLVVIKPKTPNQVPEPTSGLAPGRGSS